MKLQAAKLRLTVNSLSGENIPEAKPGKEIIELYGYSSNYTINQIPSATISVPLGGKMEGSTVTKATKLKDWANRLQKRTPVSVVLEVKSEEGIAGLPKGKYCIFKGYPSNINTSYSAKQGTLEVSLQHWLADLTLIPILNPLSSPENPANIAMESCFRATNQLQQQNSSGIESGPAWTPACKAADIVKEKKGDLFAAIKEIFSQIATTDYQLTPSSAGYKSKELYQKVAYALDHVNGENLTLNPIFNADNPILSASIGNALAAQTSATYYSVTIWDKLITTLLPSFNMTLAPLVSKAAVIPAPGIFMKNKEKPDVTADDTIQVNLSLSKTGMLAGMGLVCRSTISIEGPCAVPNGHVSCYRYPTHTKPGVFKICQLPSWLELYLDSPNVMSLKQKGADTLNFADPEQKAVKTANDENKKLQQQTEQNYTTYDKICQAFVKTSYFSEVTRQNSALLIANLDFKRVPGSLMKIQLPTILGNAGDAEYIFGMITSVGHTITSNSVQATYRLNHIRDTTLLKDPDLDSSQGLIFEKGWDSTGSSLAEKIND